MYRIKRVISLFLAALFISYHAGITLFSHTHIISGTTIVHSHIHVNSHHKTESGGHTKQTITLIAQISHFEYIDFLCDYFSTPQQFQFQPNSIIDIAPWVAPIHLKNLSLRAPPVTA